MGLAVPVAGAAEAVGGFTVPVGPGLADVAVGDGLPVGFPVGLPVELELGAHDGAWV